MGPWAHGPGPGVPRNTCNENKHNGRGKTHNTDQYKKAYNSAIEQLLSTDYDTEFAHQIGAESAPPIIGDLKPETVIDSTYFFC